MKRVAALFVITSGPYSQLDWVDVWDKTRDARQYKGPHPVVAHPPCSRWCQLAPMIQKKYGHKVGDDSGCFKSALQSVRKYGGVLEHPARTRAWKEFSLQAPSKLGWTAGTGGWVCEVAQAAYGHRAIKKTWLYFVGSKQPRELCWTVPKPTAQVSFCKNHGNSQLPRLSKRAASETPIGFRDLLLSLILEDEELNK